jgi:hypothetical protein
MQLDFAQQIVNKTKENVLIVAPLAVSKQTKKEGEKFEIEVNICRSQQDVKSGINITNYEVLNHFETNSFIGVVLDESSILKSYSGKIRNEIIESFNSTPYKLACTATPAPNDYMELGNHAEFLNIMTRSEMLATFFVHDGGDTSKWRLKGHAEGEFWKWVSTWAVIIKNPNELGYKQKGYELPRLNFIEHVTESEKHELEMVIMPAETLTERRQARKESLETRVKYAADIVNNSDEQWLVWCDFNDESSLLTKSITHSVEVKGSDTPEHKENAGIEFAQGKIKALVSKPSIYGFGMNWQNSHNIIFCGLSDSYEQFYQAVRRCWRFGQKNEVNVHVISSERGINVLDNIKRKEQLAEEMSRKMIQLTQQITISEINNVHIATKKYTPMKKMNIPQWLKEAQ